MIVDALIYAIRSRGNDAITLRDAVHEACHASDIGLDPPWSRERIHNVLVSLPTGGRSEILARAVEQLVCRQLGQDPGSVLKWAFTSVFEARSSGVYYPSLKWFVERVEDTMKSEETKVMVDKILRLV